MSFSSSSQQTASKKVSQIVSHIKQLLQEQQTTTDYQKTIRHIQNQIDGKENEIREIFSRNINPVVQHYLKYYEVCTYQKRLEAMCEQFQKKIQKTQKLSQYDQKMIQRSQQMLGNMAKVKTVLCNYREHIRLIKKITINLNEEKYNNAIKLYHKAKNIKLQKLEKTPLVKCLPIIKQKIVQHLQRLMDIFWQQNSPRQLQLGLGIFQKILMTQKQKSQIYQAFFSTSNNRATRMSSLCRNSLFKNSFVRQSVIGLSGTNQPKMNFLKNMSQDSQMLQKIIIRANVEMAQLKQVRFLYEELQNDKQGERSFIMMVKDNVFKNLRMIHQNTPCENEEDYKKILSHLIGFLLVCREVISHFSIDMDQNLFVGEIYGILSKEVKSIIKTIWTKFTIQTSKQISLKSQQSLNNDQSNKIIKLKQYSDIFYMILHFLKIQKNPRAYTLLLQDLLKTYCTLALEKYEVMITHQIQNDTLIVYKAQSEEQQQSLSQILSLQGFQRDKKGDLHYNFTGFVVFVITVFEEFYQNILVLVKDSNCNKSILHQQLAQILERIISLYGSELITKDHPLQICQGQVNLLYCQKLYKHYSTKLQIQHKYSRTTEPQYQEKLSQLIIELRRRIRELVEQKIELMMDSYYAEDHKQKRDTHADYVEWLMEYVRETVTYMKEIRSTFVEEILYSIMTHISYFYWEYLKKQKQFSLITIHNLNLDLTFIYKFISKNLPTYHSITQKLKSLQQFYSLMLTNNVNDICDPKSRALSYQSIDLHTLLQILPRYNRVNCNGLRDLKKRDLQPVIKKLMEQIY